MKIAVVTSLYPTQSDPYRGLPVLQTVQALRKYADVCLIGAKPYYLLNRKLLDESPSHQVIAPLDFEVVSYPAMVLFSRPWNGQNCAKRLAWPLARLKPDLVLSYWLYPEAYAAIEVGKTLGVPVVVGARGSDLRFIPDPFTRRKVAATVQAADSVLLVSDEMRRVARELGASEDKMQVIINGCNHKIFNPGDRDRARTECGLKPEEAVILFVGRLTRHKGLIEMLGAFQAIAGDANAPRLVCVGEGAMAGYIADFGRKWGLENRLQHIRALPPPDVARWMQAADVLCLPSHTEGCPNVVIEANSCGCPVVATNVGGIPEITDADCSILVDTLNVSNLASALRQGLHRKWDRQAISTRCTRSWDQVAKETYAVCEKVANRHRKPRASGTSQRLRVTVVTSYFPQTSSPYRGHSAFQTLLSMRSMAEINVISPRPAYPFNHTIPYEERMYGDLEVRYVGYPAIAGFSRAVNGFTCLAQIMPLLRERRPDVILNYWLYPDGFSAVRAGEILGIPVVVSSIGSDLRRITDVVTRRFVKTTLREAEAVITVSEELRQRAIAFGASPDKVKTILNGFDRDMFFPGEQGAARCTLGLEGAGELILYVGNLLKTKGVEELIKAFAALQRARPNARLAVIGEGAYASVAQQLAASAGIADKVLLMGRKSSAEIGVWMRAADLFCLPSYSEGCPNVVVEALACGLPIVATNVGGIPELISSDTVGILVPPMEVERLHQALETALTRRYDRAHIARLYNRSWQEVAEETFEVCSTAAGLKQRLATTV